MERFGQRLRLLREAAKKSLKEVADVLNCSVVYVSDIERGRRNPPSPEKIAKMAEVISAPVRELLDLANKERGRVELDLEGASPNLEEAGLVLARSWKNLSDEQVQKILEVLNKQGG